MSILLLALLVAGQLTLHQHSLIPESGGTAPVACSVCAFDADRLSLDSPVFYNTLEFLGVLADLQPAPVRSATRLIRGVRGPPLSAC